MVAIITRLDGKEGIFLKSNDLVRKYTITDPMGSKPTYFVMRENGVVGFGDSSEGAYKVAYDLAVKAIEKHSSEDGVTITDSGLRLMLENHQGQFS